MHKEEGKMLRMFSDDFVFGIGIGCVIMVVVVSVIMIVRLGHAALNAPGCGAVEGG